MDDSDWMMRVVGWKFGNLWRFGNGKTQNGCFLFFFKKWHGLVWKIEVDVQVLGFGG